MLLQRPCYDRVLRSFMITRLWILAGACIFLSAAEASPAAPDAAPDTASDDAGPNVALSVPAGAPVRLYLTKRFSSRVGTQVEGKILEPVFAFDREVVPAGSAVTGMVSRTQPVSKWLRLRSILNGDFTPLHTAWVKFDSLTLPAGNQFPLHTVEMMGLNSIYVEPSKKKQKAPLAG